MIIYDFLKEIKSVATKPALLRQIYNISIVVLLGFASFGLGRLSAIEEQRQPVRIETYDLFSIPVDIEPEQTSLPNEEGVAKAGPYVASKNGSRFHLPSCPGAKQIKQENMVWFNTKNEAAAAGYSPASNCPGL
jgi:hypothetical protein